MLTSLTRLWLCKSFALTSFSVFSCDLLSFPHPCFLKTDENELSGSIPPLPNSLTFSFDPDDCSLGECDLNFIVHICKIMSLNSSNNLVSSCFSIPVSFAPA
jgi:hypothetical protein